MGALGWPGAGADDGLRSCRGLLVVCQARQVARIINGVFLNGWDLAAAGPYFAILLPIIVLRALAALGWMWPQ